MPQTPDVFRVLVVASMLLPAGCAGRSTAPTEGPPLRTVEHEHVDLERYLGTWYEIAS